MSYEVSVRRVEACWVAVVRQRARLGDLAVVVPRGCGEVWSFLREHGLTGAGRNIAMYRDCDASGLQVACGVEIAEPFAGDGRVECARTPPGWVAAATHWGDYSGLAPAHRAVQEWCRSRDLECDGVSWELYGHWSDDPAQLRTDIVYHLNEEAAQRASALASARRSSSGAC